MIKKSGLKFQFLCLIALEIFLWSLLSEVYWLIAEKIMTKGSASLSPDLWTPDLIYVIGSVAVLFFSTLPLIFYLFRRINSPVKKITDGIRWISKGKYRHINVKGSSEFVEIAESINKMSDSLSEMEKCKAEIEKERILLFANMAHDLKTPVTSILGYSKALGEGMVEDKEKQKEYLMTMTSKAMRINELIDRLFEYVKIESPENVLHKTDCDVAEILRNCVADIYTDMEEKNIELELNITEQVVIKNADRLEIGRVFSNILNNALKHTTGGIEKQIKDAMKNIILPSGVYVGYEGSWQTMQQQGSAFAQIIILAMLLVFGVMAGTYGSFKAPFINMMTIPFMFIGVILVYFLKGQSISLMTLLGLVMLVGIVVNNGIILVDYTNLLIARGKSLKKACLEAGACRFRPVIMTTLTTVLGMLPMCFNTKGSAALVQPIGLGVVGGLLSSTFVTLVLIPVLYSLIMVPMSRKEKFAAPFQR